MNLHLIDQDGATFAQADLALGVPGPHGSLWTHLRDSLGAYYWPDTRTVRLTNGVVNAGTAGGVYLSRIEYGSEAWGAGREYIPVRAALYLGGGWWEDSRVTSVPVGGIEIPLPEAYKGAPADLRRQDLGAWTICGPYFNEGGGTGIDVIGGWRQNTPLSFEQHRLTMHRTPLDCVDKATGKPLEIAGRFYEDTCGCSKGGQLAEFCEPIPGASQYNDTRQPRLLNTGACEYRSVLEGFVYVSQTANGPWHGWTNGQGEKADGQHRIRSMCEARTLALAGYKPARLDLDMIANDCAMAQDAMGGEYGQGSAGAGRAAAWTIEALRWARNPMAETMADWAESIQMPNGQYQRRTYEQRQEWNPKANLPFGDDAGQTMEAALMGYSLAATGRWESLERMAVGVFGKSGPVRKIGYVPKFVSVAARNGVTYRSLDRWDGGADYFSHIAPGLLACRALQSGQSVRPYIEWMLSIPTPTMGRARTDGAMDVRVADLKRRLSLERIGAGQTAAAMSALERL